MMPKFLYVELRTEPRNGLPPNISSVSLSLCSADCLRRSSRCHEFPPGRSVLGTSLHGRKSKIRWSQVSVHCFKPGLPWTTDPPSPTDEPVGPRCRPGELGGDPAWGRRGKDAQSTAGDSHCGQCLIRMASPREVVRSETASKCDD